MVLVSNYKVQSKFHEYVVVYAASSLPASSVLKTLAPPLTIYTTRARQCKAHSRPPALALELSRLLVSAIVPNLSLGRRHLRGFRCLKEHALSGIIRAHHPSLAEMVPGAQRPCALAQSRSGSVGVSPPDLLLRRASCQWICVCIHRMQPCEVAESTNIRTLCALGMCVCMTRV